MSTPFELAIPPELPTGVHDFAEQAAAFRPPPWLRNPHLQSTLNNIPWVRAGVLRRARALLKHTEQHILDCGDSVRLLGLYSRQQSLGRESRGLVLLLHGWEGSADSTYVLSLGALLFAQGYDIFRLNLRDHGDTHHLNPELFHSCRIAEVVGAVKRVHEQFAPRRMSLVGFSLGGNFALRVALHAPAVGIALERVIAVCPALSPHATMAVLESGPLLYNQYFVNKWKKSLRIKQSHFPQHYDLRDILNCTSIMEMTECLVKRYTDIGTLDNYFNGYSIVGDALAPLTVPSVVIAASDDPIIPAQDLQRLARNPKLSVFATRYGGHCGFMDSWSGERWLDRQIAQLLDS